MNVAPKLKTFEVQGWLSDPDNRKAPHAQAAARTYARCNQIPTSLWDNGTANPPIVIRVK